MKDNTIIIGIGGAGCKIVSKLDMEVQKAYIDTDLAVKSQYSGLYISDANTGISSLDRAELAAVKSKTEILELIKDYENVMIVSMLGGGTSNGITKKVAEFVKDSGKNVEIMISIPADWEEKRKERAIEMYAYLKELFDVVYIKRFEPQVSMSVNEYFNRQDEMFIEKITELIS